MKWFRRKRKAETPELQTWTYWCRDCYGRFQFPAEIDLMAFVEQHKASHRGDSLTKDWS